MASTLRGFSISRTVFSLLRSDPECEVPRELETFFLGEMVRAAEEKRGAAVRLCQDMKVTGVCKV